MSKKFKSQASSARAASTLPGGFGFGSSFQTSSSPLSYVTESPDLSRISESNIVVAFKNLSKKDGTTKAKALEELLENVTKDVELGVLQAWADIYPRTSIDNSRRVRQLAQTIQGSLTVSAGKRIAPLLPKVIGSWLAGTFDADKSVARSAQDALERSFATPEKRKALWSAYKDSLFEYIEDAIIMQTASTLSDERTTSADDSEAKYVRVVGTAMNLLTQLLKDRAENSIITTLLGGKKLWELASSNDAYLRRSVCDLVMVANQSYLSQLEWSVISTQFLSKGLPSNQTGSTRLYTEALVALTKQRSQLWTTDYTAKTAVSKRLIQFLKKGSQNGPEDVWSNIAILIKLIPEDVWMDENRVDSATNLIEALRTGVAQPTERINAVSAWTAYVQTCLWLAGKIQNGQAEFVNQQLVPLIQHYVVRKQEQQWNLTTRAQQICTGTIIGILKLGTDSIFEVIWMNLISSTIDEMKLSQPETSKDYRSSQDAVIDQAKRLFALKSGILKTGEASDFKSFFQQADNKMLDTSIQLLKNRNGKPYSAAGVMEIIVSQPDFDRSDGTIQKFLADNLQPLLNSPSIEKLTSVALLCEQPDVVNALFVQRSPNGDKALCHALIRITKEQFSQDMSTELTKTDPSQETDRQLLVAAMQNPALKDIHTIICDQIQKALTVDSIIQSKHAALSLLQELLAQPMSTNIITSDQYGTMLLPNLLLLADTGDDISEAAQSVISKLNSNTRLSTGSISIIQQQLNGEGPPLTMYLLIDLANDVLQTEGVDLSTILPTNHMWEKALLPHMSHPRPYALTITSPLQGLLYTVDTVSNSNGLQARRDQDDYSLAFRLAIYTTKLLTSAGSSKVSEIDPKSVYSFYPLVLQLINESLTIDDANGIWRHSTPEVLEEASDVLSEGNLLIQSWLKDTDFVSYWLKVLHDISDDNYIAYTTASAWTNVAARYIDQFGPSQLLQNYETDLEVVHKGNYIIRSAALLAVVQDNLLSTTYAKRMLNELVASVTELKHDNVKPLVLLNIFLHGAADGLDEIPTQRVVFLLKNLVRLLEDRATRGMQSEAMKLLNVILPQVQEIYGEHWGQIIGYIVQSWSGDIDLPTMNSSVRLYARLKDLLRNDDANEDLQDAYAAAKADLDTGLVDCLQQLSQGAQAPDQPRAIIANSIKRQLRDVELKDIHDIFVLLSSEVDEVRNAAFQILHRTIPEQQEQLSMEMILEKHVAHLPQELMVILSSERNNSTEYMLAWKLVFDHFSKASYKLREAYTANLKESGNIDKLLDYVCETLRIVSGRPVDASKFEITKYNIDEAESTEQSLFWIVIHNYYNALLYVPSLAKEWFISQKNRVKSPLETWTQKYISPMIVTASLSTVTDWANAQSQDEEEERQLTIKSSPRGSELTAAITVDPESPPISIAISLPGSYPLESPIVTSRTRVGVSEKNWQSWLRTIQIIVFSTGSIIEGLIAFRKNVQGALKGQSECAICYSIIGTDMQTPNKKCGTCKNNFHGTCLFRWFKSSNSSSCPLCRNNFNYA